MSQILFCFEASGSTSGSYFLFNGKQHLKKPLECFVVILHAGVKGRLPLGSMPPDNVHLHFLLCLSLNGLVHRGLLELIYMDVSCSHLCILNSER